MKPSKKTLSLLLCPLIMTALFSLAALVTPSLAQASPSKKIESGLLKPLTIFLNDVPARLVPTLALQGGLLRSVNVSSEKIVSVNWSVTEKTLSEHLRKIGVCVVERAAIDCPQTLPPSPLLSRLTAFPSLLPAKKSVPMHQPKPVALQASAGDSDYRTRFCFQDEGKLKIGGSENGGSVTELNQQTTVQSFSTVDLGLVIHGRCGFGVFHWDVSLTDLLNPSKNGQPPSLSRSELSADTTLQGASFTLHGKRRSASIGWPFAIGGHYQNYKMEVEIQPDAGISLPRCATRPPSSPTG